MLEIGKTYKFRVTDSFQNRKEERMYEMKLANGKDDNTYVVFPLKSQKANLIPTYLYCKVKDFDERGRARLEQDEYYLYKSLYGDEGVFEFLVEAQIENSKAGNKRYLISSKFGYTHVFTAHRTNEELAVGTKIQLKIWVKSTGEGKVLLYFSIPSESLGQFAPKTVFEASGHKDDYVGYFLNFHSIAVADAKLIGILQEMQEKIQLSNRLWFFDYINALFCYVASLDKKRLDEIAKISILIRDLETWLLEESGILTKFNPENRENTRQKSEQIIERVEAVNSAVELIKSNAQNTFLHETLTKLRKSMYLRNRKQVFSILYNLITLDDDFVKQNIIGFSELIDYSSHEINDTYVLERMVNMLSNIINANRKKINTELHYQRNGNADKNSLVTLIIGIGTLLNFHAIKELDKKNEFGIQTNQLFPSLCKYLSFFTSKEDALVLTNKALQWVMGTEFRIKIPGKILWNVQNQPENLVSYILGLQVVSQESVYRMVKNSIFMKYENDAFMVSQLPAKVTATEKEVNVSSVYSVPGTKLNVVSFVSSEKWKNSDSFVYYKTKWKELLNQSILQTTMENEVAEIKVKSINHDFKNLVFCAREDTLAKDDGVISFKGYAPNFRIMELDEIFEAGMRFRAKILRNSKGQVNFDIVDNIIEYSITQLEVTPTVQKAICLGYSAFERKAIFVTEYGLSCECIITTEQKVFVNHYYKVKLQSSTNSQYPQGCVLSEVDCVYDKVALLRKQLKGLSDYNKVTNSLNDKATYLSQFPYVHLILDNYIRLFDDKIVKYNLLQIARLVAIAEKSSLSTYYAACILYMELKESFVENDNVGHSISCIEWDEKLLTQFPTLRNRANNYKLLSNFDSDNDIEFLYQLATNTNVSEQTNKFARLSLAASLIESVSDDERPICYLRRIVADELCDAQNRKDSVLDLEVAEEKQEEDDKIDFGIEGQEVEFKTSIAFYAGNTTHTVNFEAQIFVILKVIAGFLNAKGGTLYIGVSDGGKAVGIDADLNVLNCNVDKYERLIRETIVKEFNKDVNSVIEFSFVSVLGAKICKIIVPQYYTAIALRGEFYQRQGNETRIIKGNDLVMFIRRKIEGKETIIIGKDADLLSDKDWNVSQVPANMLPRINDNAHSFEVCFYIDGTYQIGPNLDSKDVLVKLNVDENCKNNYLLQCYDNGCINKVPVKNFFNMQKNYQYKNGVNKDANLMQVIIASDSDFVAIISRQGVNKYIKIFPVSGISAHTTLGLRGNQLLSQNYDLVVAFYVVPLSAVSYVEKLITSTRSNLGRKMDSPAFRREVTWFEKNLINQKSSVKNADDVSALLGFVESGKFEELSMYLNSQISEKRNIPKIRKDIQNLLKKCNSSQVFWQVIYVILECDIAIFRMPIAEILNEELVAKFPPEEKVLDKIIKQLFTFSHKYDQSLEFVFPLRSRISEKSRNLIFQMSKDLNSPEAYEALFVISHIRLEEALTFLLQENNVASNYTLFDMLDTYRKHAVEENVIKYADMCLGKLPKVTSANYYLCDLLCVYILKTPPKFFSEEVLRGIREGGFEAFRTSCVSRDAKSKSKETVAGLKCLIDLVVNVKVVQEYAHHYLLSYKDGVMVLLQKTWSLKQHEIGDYVSVKILSVNKAYKVMFATEIDDSLGLPQKQPLLNVNDRIEVAFSEHNGFYIPTVKHNYSRLKVRVISYPFEFDVKKQYEAVVVKQNSNFEFDIRLLDS